MDQVFEGLLQANKSEREKREVIRLIVSTGEKKQDTQATVKMLEAASRVLLNGSSGFQWDAAKEVYLSWGSNNVIALRHYFTAEVLHSLLDGIFPNNFNAVWIMRESIFLLRDMNDSYKVYCDILQQKATTFIRTHSAFHTVVPFCRLLREFREGIPRSVMTPLFCNTVIDVVSLYNVPRDCQPIEYITNTSDAIGGLLGHIWEKCNKETMWRSLKHVFELIKLGGNGSDGKSPSVALAAIVQYFPTNSIPSSLHSLLQDPAVQPSHIRIALERMMSWLQWPGARHIDLWVNGFLHELASARKFALLIDVTESTVEKVFRYCKFVPVRDSALAVLTVMLMGYKHSPLAFHKIADGVPSLVVSLKEENTPESLSFLKKLNLLVHCMMHLHPGFPEIYEAIIDSTKDLDQPSLQQIEEQLSDRGWVVSSGANRSLMLSSPPSSAQLTDKRGLENLGNTCYMNSIIQALFMCDSFRQDVLAASVSSAERVKAKLQRAFAFLSISARPFINPMELMSVIPPWFEQGQQQDCSEFLKYLLDQMHEQEISSPRTSTPAANSHKSLVQKTYSGKVQNTYTCLKCGNKSVKLESFYDLPLAFQKSKSTPKLSRDHKKDSVDNLLAHFLEAEKMQGDNKYRCDKCNKLQEAERSMKIVDAPNFLILTLMRFSYDVRSQHRSKIFTDVYYPKELLLPVDAPGSEASSSTKSNHHSLLSSSKNGSKSNPQNHERYALVGVVVHSGPSLDGGHYYTYARSSADPADLERWFLFNDHRVTRSTYTSFSAVQRTFSKDTAYVLLYHKLGPKAAPVPRPLSLRADLQQLVERDNVKYMQEYAEEQRRSAMSRPVHTTPWWGGHDHDDNNPPPGPGAGLGGPRLVF